MFGLNIFYSIYLHCDEQYLHNTFGIGQKAMKAYECPVPVKTIYIYTVHGIIMHKIHLVENIYQRHFQKICILQLINTKPNGHEKKKCK
jgi:hypothetical protein